MPLFVLFCFPFVFIWDNFVLLQESERYAYEWQRCLESALEVCVLCSRVIKITKIHWNVFFSQDFTCHVCLGIFYFLETCKYNFRTFVFLKLIKNWGCCVTKCLLEYLLFVLMCLTFQSWVKAIIVTLYCWMLIMSFISKTSVYVITPASVLPR